MRTPFQNNRKENVRNPTRPESWGGRIKNQMTCSACAHWRSGRCKNVCKCEQRTCHWQLWCGRERRPGLRRADLAPFVPSVVMALSKQKLKEISFFWQTSNYMEASTAVSSGVNRRFLRLEISHFVSFIFSNVPPLPRMFLEMVLSNHKAVWIKNCSGLFKGWWKDCPAKTDCSCL